MALYGDRLKRGFALELHQPLAGWKQVVAQGIGKDSCLVSLPCLRSWNVSEVAVLSLLNDAACGSCGRIQHPPLSWGVELTL